MFERFTEDARRVLFFSRVIAAERTHDAIEPEDLLRSIVVVAPGLFADGVRAVLTAGEVLQTDPREGETLWNGIERLKAAHGFRNTAREIPFSSAVKRVLQFGADEADALRHTDIRPPHLLLGLLREEGAEAWRTLTEAGVRLADVRRSVGAQE